MKAFLLSSFDAPPALHDRVAIPVPRANEVLVRVEASSVNPVDNAVAGGMLKNMIPHEFPITLGRDYAGVVEKIGDDVARFEVGDEVFGSLPLASPAVHHGSWAELIAVPEYGAITSKPEGVSFVTAGAAGLAGLAAMLAMDALALSKDDTVLIVGATGGVGSCAVQLAVRAGATVIAPGLTDDAEYLSWLGVSTQIDRNASVVDTIRAAYPNGVDALLDVVSFTPDAFNAHAALLKPGGRAASTNGAAGDGNGRVNVVAFANADNLQRLAFLLETDVLTIPIQRAYPLHKAADAMRAVSNAHNLGKIGIA